MARGDRSGPEGSGPMTGRGAGYCSGSGIPGFMNRTNAWTGGCGRGRGFAGRRVREEGSVRGSRLCIGNFGSSFSTPDEDEKGRLKKEKEFLMKKLEALDSRLAEWEERE